MLTKKHYKMIANCIHGHYNENTGSEVTDSTHKNAILDLAYSLCKEFYADNNKFSYDKFINAITGMKQQQGILHMINKIPTESSDRVEYSIQSYIKQVRDKINEIVDTVNNTQVNTHIEGIPIQSNDTCDYCINGPYNTCCISLCNVRIHSAFRGRKLYI